MDFLQIAIENFLSYQHQVFNKFRPGLTLVEGRNLDDGGSNGAGKSSPWDAISWCLFGQTVRGLKNDSVVRRGESGCIVSVSLRHAGCDYVVTRSRGPNSLIVEKDGETIQQGTIALTESWILNEFGIDFDLFRCTVLYAQGETFNFVDESNKKQKEVLSKIVRADFSHSLSSVKAEIKRNNSDISEIDGKISILNSHKVDNPEIKFKAEAGRWKSENTVEINSVLEERNGYEKELESSPLIMSEHLRQEILERKESLILDIAGLKVKKEEYIDKRGRVAGTMSARLGIRRQWLDLAKSGKCPTCLSPAGDLSISSKLAGEESKIIELESLNKKMKSLIDKFENKISDMGDKVESMVHLLDIRDIAIEKKNSLEDKIKNCDEIVLELRGKENPFKKIIEAEVKKQERIKSKIKELSKKSEKLADESPYIKFWEDAFGDAGIKSFIFDLICSSLTSKANKYASVLTNGQVAIEFDTQTKLKSGALREKFEVGLVTQGERVEYESYSGGEKRRISLAVDLALSDIMSDYYGSSFNIIVFDEQTNYMDRAGRECFMNLLLEMSKTKCVLVVDHDAEFKSQFDDVWVIEKKDGISRMVP